MNITLIISGGILLGCLLALSWFAGSDAPYVPTKLEAIRKILKLAEVKKGKKFYELGSGDGRVVVIAAKLGANSIGIEQSWLRVLYSRWKAHTVASHTLSGNLKFYHGDIFKRNYSDADIVYIYLLLKGVSKLETKLKNELRKGAIVITQTYHFPNWKPYKKYDLSKEIDFSKDIIFRGITIKGVIGRRMFSTWELMRYLLTNGLARKILDNHIISHDLSLEDFQKGFDAIKAGDAYKIILRP